MNSLPKGILTGLLFIAGIFGFINGEYIISSALFAATTYSSNMRIKGEKHQH